MDDEEGAKVETEMTVTMKEEFVIEDSTGREYPGWRVPLSIGMGIGWLVFLVVWLFFYAGDYHIYQNIGMVIISIMVVTMILGGAWIAWAFGNITEFEEMMLQIGGMKRRMILSIVVPMVCFIFLGLWLFFMAVDFDTYQNIAIVVVTILVMAGILGVTWTTGGWKMGGRS